MSKGNLIVAFLVSISAFLSGIGVGLHYKYPVEECITVPCDAIIEEAKTRCLHVAGRDFQGCIDQQTHLLKGR